MTQQEAETRRISPALRVRNEAIIASFSLAEHVLFKLSKDPATTFQDPGWTVPTERWDVPSALRTLRQEFPDLDDLIRDKRVLDYGCGDGFQAIALAGAGAKEVLGVDILPERLEHGKRLAESVPNVSFATAIAGTFDVAVMLDSFEHLPYPEANLAELIDALNPNGKLLIEFGPPWLAPYGSHMHFFTRFPWVNILFSEKTVFRVRALYRDDDARMYFPGVNKMTIRRFERLIRASGLKVERLQYHTVMGLPLAGRIPGLREFFINHVSCVLTKQVSRSP